VTTYVSQTSDYDMSCVAEIIFMCQEPLLTYWFIFSSNDSICVAWRLSNRKAALLEWLFYY